MTFQSLSIQNWRQFEGVEIAFDRQVTILTGANGAGKSTILRLLSQHFGWNYSLLGTPTFGKTGVFEYLYRRKLRASSSSGTGQDQVGSIGYENGIVSPIMIPSSGGISYNVMISNAQPVPGLFIGSHRAVLNYQPVTSIPTTSIGAEQAYQQYHQESVNRYNNAYTQFGPTYRMKEAIISMAMFGPGNKNVIGNPESEKVFEDFEATLRAVLPSELGFMELNVRIPDVVMVTKTGDFVLDAASGGIMSLVDLAWQIFLYSRGKSNFVVLLDEPENHLHPSMQRSILQKLVLAFPTAQFVVATHSPFIVSSVREARVYVLSHNVSKEAETKSRTVSSTLLDQISKAGTASEILRDALGVPVTMPMWAEEQLRQISNDFSITSLGDDQIIELKRRLASEGLDEFYPDALSQIARRA